MKKLIFILFLIYSYNASGQDIFGKYYCNEGGFLKVSSNNKIEFKIKQVGCFGEYFIVGYGEYKLRKNKLVVKTQLYPNNFDSKYKGIRTKTAENNKINFIVFDSIKNPLIGVEIYYVINNKINLFSTDNNGKASIDNFIMPDDSLIHIKYLGYQPLNIRLIDNKLDNFEIILQEGTIECIENKKIKFKIIMKDNEVILNGKNFIKM